jgi:orotate phosphoribosyltransferase
MNTHLEELKSRYVEGIYQTKALLIRETPFTLQSGKKSHIYLNHRNFLSQHNYLALVTQIYTELAKQIKGEFMLGAVDSITSPIIVGALSYQLKMDYVVLKRTPLTHGTQEYIYGKLAKPVLLIDDMTSTGESLIDAAEKIRQQGGVVTHAIISAYREMSAIHHLKAQQIEPISIASFAEIIERLLPGLTDKERAIVQSHPLIFNE